MACFLIMLQASLPLETWQNSGFDLLKELGDEECIARMLSILDINKKTANMDPETVSLKHGSEDSRTPTLLSAPKNLSPQVRELGLPQTK